MDDTADDHPLYRALIRQLPISGASIAVFDVSGRQSTVWASDPVAARLEELQFDLREGPHWQALSQGHPALIPDITEHAHDHWPVFGTAVAGLGIGAMFSFPMLFGAVSVGVVDMYRSHPGTFSHKDYVLAISLCGRVAKHAVAEALREARNEPLGEQRVPAMRREVHQATGVVLVQLGVTATEAFFILRAYAFSNGLAVLGVAQDVLAGRLDFAKLPD